MKTIYSYYVLDLIHRGHIRQMKNCKTIVGKDGISIVGILTDKAVMEQKQKPILSFDERLAVADAIKYNDLVVPQETYSPIENIKVMRPDFVAESTSHKAEAIKEAKKYAKVFTFPYFPEQSSTNIKRKIKR